MEPKQGVNIRYVSGVTSYNINWADDVINVDTSLNAVTIYLPSIAQGGTNKRFYINDYNGNAATNNITIATSGTDVVNGAATKVLSANGVTSELLISGVGEWLANTDAPSSVGTVTSVGLALPASVFNVTGSPVTGSGTLTGAFVTQSANTVFAGPTTGGAAVPAFRALVAADIPDIGGTYFKNGGNSFGANATIGLNDGFALTIETNNAARINILSTGEVGIGVAGAASTALTVKGATTDSSAYAERLLDSSNNVNFYVRNDGAVNSRLGYWLADNRVLWSNNLTGSLNLFCGYLAGNSSITDGALNTGFGYQSLSAVVSGDNNAAFGSRSLFGLSGGNNNNAVGDYTGPTVTTGSNNIFMGFASGQSLINPSSSISLGGNTSSSPTLSINNIIAIGFGATCNNSESFEGLFGGSDLVIKNMYVGAGKWAASASLFDTKLQITSPPPTGNAIGIAAESNTGGGNFIIASSQSTGNVNGGDLIFQTAAAGGAGSTANALATRMIIKGAGSIAMGTSTPIASTLLTIKGTGTTASTFPIKITDSADVLNYTFRDDGKLLLGNTTPTSTATITRSVDIGGQYASSHGTANLKLIVYNNTDSQLAGQGFSYSGSGQAEYYSYVGNAVFDYAWYEAGNEVARLTGGVLSIRRLTNQVGQGNSISFQLSNASNALATYGAVGAEIVDNTAGAQDGSLFFYATNNASLNKVAVIEGATGNMGVGILTAIDARMHIKGSGNTSGTYSVKAQDSGSNINFYVRDDGAVNSRLGYWCQDEKILYYGATSKTNIFAGYGSGNLTQTGNNNSAYGSSTLISLTDGFQNSAFGVYSGTAVTSGINNTGFGFETNKAVNTGNNNVSLGSSANVSTTSGSNNIVIGCSSDVGQTGSQNIAIGCFISHTGATNYSSSIAIGHLAVTTASNQFVMGSPTAKINNMWFSQGQVGVAGNGSLSAVSFTVTGIVAGSSNEPASNGIIYWDGAAGTGTGVGGDLVWRVAMPGSTGSAINAMVTKMTLSGTTGSLVLAAGTTAGAPLNITAGVAPSSPVDGDIWYVNTNDRLMFRRGSTSAEILSVSAVTTETVTADRTLTVAFDGNVYKLEALFVS